MGFEEVYRTLMELFPQVDSRILKAVAIELPGNAESAVECVISEVIHSHSHHSAVGNHLSEDGSSSAVSSGRAEDEEQTKSLQCHQVGVEKTVSSCVESRSTANDDTYKTANDMFECYSSAQEKAVGQTSVLSCGSSVDSNQLQCNSGSEELIIFMRSLNENETSNSGATRAPKVISSGEDIAGPTSTDTNVLDTFAICQETQDTNARVEQDTTFQTSSGSKGGGSGGSLTNQFCELKDFDGTLCDKRDDLHAGRSPQTELCSDGMNSRNSMVEEASNPVEGDIQADFPSGSKFCHEIQIDNLENIIEAAKDHKATLFLEVECVMNKMREVELEEKIAEQANEEADSAGLETLAKVEGLKQMLAHAKEANDMHAGEVYGEKSILATEVKELQARLLSLSDERDKALAILDEIKRTLEARLAMADELKKTAHKQKLEKEEAAGSGLAEQEAIMEKVVQESKILQHQADQNSKLREFLVDRGHVVDALQGEISVICHDVRLLKEKLDEKVPLSKLISSNQTSCILASSASSVKSVASDPILQHRETFNKVRSAASSIDGRSLTNSVKGKSPISEENGERDNIFAEDDWEFLNDSSF